MAVLKEALRSGQATQDAAEFRADGAVGVGQEVGSLALVEILGRADQGHEAALLQILASRSTEPRMCAERVGDVPGQEAVLLDQGVSCFEGALHVTTPGIASRPAGRAGLWVWPPHGCHPCGRAPPRS